MSDQICIDWLEAPFCSGPSDPPISIPRPVPQDDYLEWWSEEEFVDFEELPFDCAAGPDPDTQEYIDSNWEQQLINNDCVELIPPVVYEADEIVEEIETISEVAIIQPLPTLSTLPETGVDAFTAVLLGLGLLVSGASVVFYGRKSR